MSAPPFSSPGSIVADEEPSRNRWLVWQRSGPAHARVDSHVAPVPKRLSNTCHPSRASAAAPRWERHGELVEEADLAEHDRERRLPLRDEPTSARQAITSSGLRGVCSRSSTSTKATSTTLSADAHQQPVVTACGVNAREVGQPVGGEDVLGAGVDQRPARLH